jgi:hypothetical protein
LYGLWTFFTGLRLLVAYSVRKVIYNLINNWLDIGKLGPQSQKILDNTVNTEQEIPVVQLNR